MSDIANRLDKNLKKLDPWAKKLGIEAYRLYDRDIPEYPFIVDRYKEYFIVYDRGDSRDRQKEKRDHLPQLLSSLKELTGCDSKKIILKHRRRQKGDHQYRKLSRSGNSSVIREGIALYEVNLIDYLDTGLFLDHRLMRERIQKEASGKSFLNLFSYTASVTVAAVLGGASSSLSVDMSKTYTSWAGRNLRLNDIEVSNHELITADVMRWLEEPTAKGFDLIFCDPPTFSNSKKMNISFEVEREQDFLVDSCMALLNPKGILYFSTNKRDFKVSDRLLDRYQIKDISSQTIPKDFRDQKIHKVFKISASDN